MAIVKRSLMDGNELTPEEHEAAKIRIQEAARRPYTYDPDSPLLTEKQLSEFRPVNFDTMEEREQAIRIINVTDSEKTVGTADKH